LQFTYSPGGAAWPAPQATGVTHEFWMATYAGKNLTWTTVSKGRPAPSNAYSIDGMLLARSLVTKPDSKKGFVGGNVIPGFVVPSAVRRFHDTHNMNINININVNLNVNVNVNIIQKTES
jgi:hypothetical protein